MRGHANAGPATQSAALGENGPPTRLWSAREVSDFLGVPVATLHQWRYQGSGPDAYRVGRHLRYDPATVQRWLAD